MVAQNQNGISFKIFRISISVVLATIAAKIVYPPSQKTTGLPVDECKKI